MHLNSGIRQRDACNLYLLNNFMLPYAEKILL